MARGINKVIIVGNLGQDPETRAFPDGGSVTNISVATSESWRDKQTGQMQDRTEWHRIVLRDRGNYRLGQIAAQYLRKGSKVYIEGALRTRKWQDQQGVERYTTEIIANELQMLDSKGDMQQGANTMGANTMGANATGGYQQNTPPAQQSAPQSQPASAPRQANTGNAAPANSAAAPMGFDDFDEDIPF